MLNSTITIGPQTQNYYKFYLPCLVQGSNPRYSQSLTIATQNVNRITNSAVNSIMINLTVTFPNAVLGFTSSFFNFKSTTVTLNIRTGSFVEFYFGEVIVSLGLYP